MKNQLIQTISVSINGDHSGRPNSTESLQSF